MSITFEQAMLAQKMGGTFYDPARHEIIETNAWAAACRRTAMDQGIANAENLFLYHHKLAGTFVLAMWVHKPGNGEGKPAKMLELLVTHGPPGCEEWKGAAFDTPTIDEVVERLQPAGVHAKKFRDNEDYEAAKLKSEQMADIEARAEAAHAMKRHDSGAAALIASGDVPIAAGDDDMGSTLGDRSKGRGNFIKPKIIVP